MKMKSVAGVVCYVKDLKKTAEFYKALGFTVTQNDEEKIAVRLNWFWLDFMPQDKESKDEFKREAQFPTKGAGQYLYISVEDVDEFYKGVLDKGLEPSSEPRDWPWGNREFVLRDPDGYKLVFFKRL